MSLLLPAQPASAACVSSTGVTVCPPVYRCFAGGVVTVTVVGVGQGSASCGGGSASCYSPRVTCAAADFATSSGTLTCTATGNAVAVCGVTIGAT